MGKSPSLLSTLFLCRLFWPVASTKVRRRNESVFLGANKNVGEERDLDLE